MIQWKKMSFSIGCRLVAVAAQRSSQPALRSFAIWSGKIASNDLDESGFALNRQDTYSNFF